MEKGKSNKAITNEEVKKGQIKKTEVYHFPGGMEYEPISIEASSQEEANKKYEELKKKVK